MAALRPRIRIKQINPADLMAGKPIEDGRRIIVPQPDIRKRQRFNLGQQFGNAVQKGFAADKPDIGSVPRTPRQMLAATKSDLKMDVLDGCCKEIAKIGWRRLMKSQTQAGKCGFDKGRLPRP